MDSSFVGVVTTPKAPPMCMVGRVDTIDSRVKVFMKRLIS